jgi:hypothetical protein
VADDARQTQDAVRHVNDRFRVAALAQQWGKGSVPFLCECADPDCVDRIEMTTHDYAATHVARDSYVVVRDHLLAEGERVIEDRGAFVVTSKTVD